MASPTRLSAADLLQAGLQKREGNPQASKSSKRKRSLEDDKSRSDADVDSTQSHDNATDIQPTVFKSSKSQLKKAHKVAKAGKKKVDENLERRGSEEAQNPKTRKSDGSESADVALVDERTSVAEVAGQKEEFDEKKLRKQQRKERRAKKAASVVKDTFMTEKSSLDDSIGSVIPQTQTLTLKHLSGDTSSSKKKIEDEEAADSLEDIAIVDGSRKSALAGANIDEAESSQSLDKVALKEKKKARKLAESAAKLAEKNKPEERIRLNVPEYVEPDPEPEIAQTQALMPGTPLRPINLDTPDALAKNSALFESIYKGRATQPASASNPAPKKPKIKRSSNEEDAAAKEAKEAVKKAKETVLPRPTAPLSEAHTSDEEPLIKTKERDEEPLMSKVYHKAPQGWERGKGKLRAFVGMSDDEMEENVAFSSQHIASRPAGVKLRNGAFTVQTITSGSSFNISYNYSDASSRSDIDGSIKICSIAAGRLEVKLLNVAFTINEGGMFRVKEGEDCSITNKGSVDAKVHVTALL